MYRSLNEYIARLEREGELVRIGAPVSPVEEIAELTDRMAKQPGGGKAILFERTGTDFPVVTNLMGSERRVALALGVVLGVGATLLQQHFGLIEIPAETFLTKSYPVEFRPTDLAVVAASFAAVAALLSNITVRSMIKTDRL